MRKLQYRTLLAVVALFLVFSIGAVDASAAQQACEGCVMGQSNGNPACMKDGQLHLCANNFPDENLQQYILNDWHVNDDDILVEAELIGLTWFQLSSKINNLKGIELLPYLGALECGSQIVGFDLSKLPNLGLLSCASTPVGTFDFSGNTKLEHLNIWGCGLTELDVSMCPNLNYLDCSDNSITSLDLSNNPKLQRLYCTNTALTEIDLSNNTQLVRVRLDRNKLSTIDVSNCPALVELSVNNNQLTELDVSNNKWLEDLWCADNQLTALELTQNPSLRQLDCASNRITELTLAPSLERLFVSKNALTSIDLSMCAKLLTLNCEGNQLGELQLSNSKLITYLTCSDNPIKELVLESLQLLETLKCDNCELALLRIGSCGKLKTVNCANNQLTALYITGCPVLETLECTGNFLTELDVSACTNLQTLVCDKNPLVAIDLSQNGQMQEVGWVQKIDYYGLEVYEVQGGYAFDIRTILGSLIPNTINYSGGSNLSWKKAEYDPETGRVIIQDEPKYLYYTFAHNGPELQMWGTHLGTQIWLRDTHIWHEATCEKPSYCEHCGETAGGAKGHSWKEGSCTEPKTCANCGLTAGEAHGHKWKDANCKDAKTCLLCGQTEGEPAGHRWKKATCKEPQTCLDCGQTHGEPGDHKADIWVTGKAPTKDEKGFRYRKCCWCEREMEREMEREDLPPRENGAVENYTDKDCNDYGGGLNHSGEELEELILTEEEKQQVQEGQQVSVSLTVEDISLVVPEEEQRKVAEKLGDHSVGFYCDISVVKQVGAGEPETVSRTNAPISITVSVPETLRGEVKQGKTFKVVRIHDGEVEILDAVYDEATGQLTFMTDAFSTYALIYGEASQADASPETTAAPETTIEGTANELSAGNGGQQAIPEIPGTGVIAAVGVIALLAVVFVLFRKKK